MGDKGVTLSVIDDDGSVRTALKRLLNASGFDFRTFASAEDFLTSGLTTSFDLLIHDVRMPGMSGIDLQRKLMETDSRVPVIFITAHDDLKDEESAMKTGAIALLHKPFEEGNLIHAIHRALGKQG